MIIVVDGAWYVLSRRNAMIRLRRHEGVVKLTKRCKIGSL